MIQKSFRFQYDEAQLLGKVLNKLDLLGPSDPLPQPYGLATGVAAKSRVYFIKLNVDASGTSPLSLVVKFDDLARSLEERDALAKLGKIDVGHQWLLEYPGSLQHLGPEDNILIYRDGSGCMSATSFLTLQKFLLQSHAGGANAMTQALEALSVLHGQGRLQGAEVNMTWRELFPKLPGTLASEYGRLAQELAPGFDLQKALELVEKQVTPIVMSGIHGDLNFSNFIVGRTDFQIKGVMLLDFANFESKRPTIFDYVKMETELWLECMPADKTLKALAKWLIQDGFVKMRRDLDVGLKGHHGKTMQYFATLAKQIRDKARSYSKAGNFESSYHTCLCLSHLRSLLYPSVYKEPIKVMLALIGAAHSYDVLERIERMEHVPLTGSDAVVASPQSAPKDTTISWLQLANLEIGAPGWRDLALRSLHKGLIKEGLKPDFVLITGGIVSSGHKAQYEKASEVLHKLASVLGLDPKRHFIIVPGSGDVDASKIKPRDRVTRQGLGADLYAELRDGEIQHQLSSRLVNFFDFANSFQESGLSREKSFQTFAFRKDQIQVGITALNSAWAGEKDSGSWLIGEPQLESAIEEASACPHDLNILLLGHAPHQLADDKDLIENRTAEMQVLCFGDPSDPNPSNKTFPGGIEQLQIPVGSCHPNAVVRFVSLNPARGEGEVTSLEFVPKRAFWRKGQDTIVVRFKAERARNTSESEPDVSQPEDPEPEPVPEEVPESKAAPQPGPTSKEKPNDLTAPPKGPFIAPVLVLDMAGFSKYSQTQKRSALKRLEKYLDECRKAMKPPPSWPQHSTGDGLYLFFKESTPDTALTFTESFIPKIKKHNERFPGLQINLRAVLAIGQVNHEDGHYEGDVLIQAARFLDDGSFKDYLKRSVEQKEVAVLAMSTEFRLELDDEGDALWENYCIRDKHGFEHHGFVLDNGYWSDEAEDTAQEEETEPKSRLEQLYDDLADIKENDGDPSFIEDEILKEKRKRRDGGTLRAGDRLSSRYRLDAIAGRGGFGIVWKAWDTLNKSYVAIKVLHGQFAEDRSRRERFFRGAKQMQAFEHPAVVRVLDAECDDDGHYYFVMDYLCGGDFRTAVKSGKYKREELLKMLCVVGDALAMAHERKIIHRDIKPGNILLDESGNALLTDFDLVHVKESTGGTRTNVGLGSFIYAPPEQMQDASTPNARSDIYGLGMTALYALYGKELPMEALRPGFVEGLGLAYGMEKVILKAIQWDMQQRYQDMTELCAGMRHALTIPAPFAGEWVRIPAGTFAMGATDLNDTTKPIHIVRISQDFYIGIGPVTNNDYRHFINAGGYKKEDYWSNEGWAWREENDISEPFDFDNSEFNGWEQPVVGVSFYEAEAYCNWLTEMLMQEQPDFWQEGMLVRLPSEAQWEYAARGEKSRRYPWGPDEPTDDHGNFEKKIGKTTKVGTYPKGATPEGLLDMAGNMWEWCRDAWDEDAYKKRGGLTVDPIVEGPSKTRALRGGSWENGSLILRPACRFRSYAGNRDWVIGFRCVLLGVSAP